MCANENIDVGERNKRMRFLILLVYFNRTAREYGRTLNISLFMRELHKLAKSGRLRVGDVTKE